MPALIPTEMDQDVLTLKVQGAQAIIAGLKTFLKTYRNQKLLSACVDILYEFAKALETPYPPNVYSAGFNYAWDPKKYTETGARVVNDITNRIIPGAINRIQQLPLTESSHHLIVTVLKYLMAIHLGENEKQDVINLGEAGVIDKMAHDVLQKQEPKMDFSRVSNLLIAPLIGALREKLLRDQQQTQSASAASFAP